MQRTVEPCGVDQMADHSTALGTITVSDTLNLNQWDLKVVSSVQGEYIAI